LQHLKKIISREAVKTIVFAASLLIDRRKWREDRDRISYPDRKTLF